MSTCRATDQGIPGEQYMVVYIRIAIMHPLMVATVGHQNQTICPPNEMQF